MTINKNQKYQSNNGIISLLRQCALFDEFMQSEDEFLSLLEETQEDSGQPFEKEPLSPAQESPEVSEQLSEEELLWAAGGISRPKHSPGDEHS